MGGSRVNLEIIREKTLEYVESMRIKGQLYGRYRPSASSPESSIYASVHAALARHLYGDLQKLEKSKRMEWINYLQSHQEDSGMFTDPLIADSAMWKEEKWEKYGQDHFTIYVMRALSALGAKVLKPFKKKLDLFKNKNYTLDWLEKRNWEDVYHTGNEVYNQMVMLQYARDFHKDREAKEVINWFYDYLDKKQDFETGIWGKVGNNSSGINPQIQGVDRQIQGTFHFLLLYFYDQRKINFKEKIIDNCFANQNKDGSFGYASACADIDSIDLLVRLSFRTSYRKKEIETSLKGAINWVLSNQNDDGGFVDRKREGAESSTFPTWFRTLSLALIAKRLPESIVGEFNWHFINCPGPQFWKVRGE